MRTVNKLAMAIAESCNVEPSESNINTIRAGIIHEEETVDMLWDFYVKKHGYTKISSTYSGLKSPTTVKTRIKKATDRILNYDLYNIENRDIRLKHTLCICNIAYANDQDVHDVFVETINSIRTCSELGGVFKFWTNEEIENAIISLSDNHQRIIMLKYYCGEDNKTIAANVYGYTSDRAESLVMSHIFEAEKFLKRWKDRVISDLMYDMGTFQTKNLK